MNKLGKWLESYKDVSTLDNRWFKLILFTLIVVLLPIQSFISLAEVPNYLYTPSPANISYYLFSRIPPKFIFQLTDTLNIFFLFMVFFGRRNFLFGILLTVNLTLGLAIYSSFGKIDHHYLNILIFPIIGYLFDKGVKGNKNWIFPTFLFLFAFTFISAGIPKILDPSYLGFEKQSFRNELLNHNNLALVKSLEDTFSEYSIILWEFLDYCAVGFEVFLPIILFFRKKFILLFITIASVFHILNDMAFGIFFTGMVYAYLFFIVAEIFKFSKKYSIDRKEYDKVFNIVLSLLCLLFLFNQSLFFHKNLVYLSRTWFYVALIILSITLLVTYKKREKN